MHYTVATAESNVISADGMRGLFACFWVQVGQVEVRCPSGPPKPPTLHTLAPWVCANGCLEPVRPAETSDFAHPATALDHKSTIDERTYGAGALRTAVR